MDHADVQGLLLEAMERPGGLVAFQGDPSAAAADARAHIAGCAGCAAEWRAWSLTTLGLASAAPDVEGPAPEVRAAIMAAVSARPRPASATMRTPARGAGPAVRSSPAAAPPAPMAGPAPMADRTAAPPPTGPSAGVTTGRVREGWVRGRDPSRAPTPAPSAARTGPGLRWGLLGAAAAVLLLVVGAVIGQQSSGGGAEPRRGDPTRALAVAAGILYGNGFGLARLTTPDGQPGGVVIVSPGSGRIAVMTDALEPPPAGVRYWCYLERDGTEYVVGPMWFDDDLAFWAGDATPVDLGLEGDVFIVRLETEGAPPALTGTF